MESLKAFWEVRAGIIPGSPKPEFTKRWEYTNRQREEDKVNENDMAHHSVFAKLRAEALDYYLQVSQPSINNWAALTFFWY